MRDRLRSFLVHEDEARALLAPELVAIENATTRLVERGMALLLARDPAFADVIADDAEMLSRRSVVSLPETRGREAVVETMVGTFSVFDTAESRPIAVRGERLALTRFLMRTDGFEVAMYVIWECDGDGRLRLSLSFDPDDLVGAAEELDARHRKLEGEDAVARFAEGADATDVDDHRPGSLFAALPEVFAARDWDRVRDGLAPDVELHDRRSTVSSSSVVGPDAIAELFRGYGEVGFETLEQRPVAVHGERFALVHRVYRTTTGFELAMLAVVSADHEGRSDRIVLFDSEDLGAATAEFEAQVATLQE